MYMPIKIIRDARKKIRLKTRGPKTFFFLYFDAHTKRPFTKRSTLKTAHYETAQDQNDPSSKRPKAQYDPSSKCPKLKTTQGTERPMAQNEPRQKTIQNLVWVGLTPS